MRAGFEPAIPATKSPQSYALARPLGSVVSLYYEGKHQRSLGGAYEDTNRLLGYGAV
jgi:hypothetical protein